MNAFSGIGATGAFVQFHTRLLFGLEPLDDRP
jgi:hypothetical protein